MGDIFNIPVDSKFASFKQRVELDDSEFVLKFDWNTRQSRWYVSLMDGNENPLVMGLNLVANFPLFNRFKGTQYPDGTMMLMDATGSWQECGRDGLGSTHYLIYEGAD